MNAIPKHDNRDAAARVAAPATDAPVSEAPGFMPMRPTHAATVALGAAAPAPKAPEAEAGADVADRPRTEAPRAEAPNAAPEDPEARAPAAPADPAASAPKEPATRDAAAGPGAEARTGRDAPSVVSDAESLKRFLTEGKGALARQADLIEMHRRLVEQMRVLGQGIAEIEDRKAAEDRRVLVERLDEVEKAVNTMEGALRIELPALLQETVDAAVARARPRRSPVLAAGGVLALVAAGFLAGVVVAPRLGDTEGVAGLRLGHIFSTLSPNGGISKAADPLE